MFTLTVRGLTLVYTRRILSTKVDPRTVRVQALKYLDINQINKGSEIIITVSLLILLHLRPVAPLSPHEASKHHFPSQKTQLIFLQLRVSGGKLPGNWFTNTRQFSLLFHPLQIIFIHYKSRIATATRGL